MTKTAPLLVALSLFFASCSSNQTETINTTPQQKLLDSYTLKRDVNGAYSIDLNTSNNTEVTTLKNSDNSNEIIFSEVNYNTTNKHTNSFSVENEKLIIGFLDTNKEKRNKITIEDENSTFARTSVTEFLNSYSVTKNNDGTFLLNFKVNNNVTSEFIYNQEIATYEVHLSEGRATQKDFSKTITLSSDENSLKIDFVNHKYSSRNKTQTGAQGPVGASGVSGRKPRIIIVNGDD